MASIRQGWRRGGRPWLAIALAGTLVVVYVLLGKHPVGPVLWQWGDVHASLGLGTELRRIPMSFMLPTPFLPIWAAAGQVLVVIGIGELVIGRTLTLSVAVVGHFASTLTTRFVLEFGRGTFLALSPALSHALDTGPSAAVTAVGACLLVGLRLNRLALLLCLSLLVATLIAPGIDGEEHLVALVCGVLGGVAFRLYHREAPEAAGRPGLRQRAGATS